MLGHAHLNMDDYLAMLRRRVWWLVVPALLGPILGYGISLMLPNRYTSQTLVLVEQQKVPEDFVKSVVTEELDQRLTTMQEQILSRTRLQPIIERFGLFQDKPGLSMEDKLDRMRNAITITAVKADFNTSDRRGVPGFYIKYSASTPRLAQQICAEITSMFMQENLRARTQSAEGTTEFLRSQLDDAKRNLDEQDAKLAAFKRQHIGQLPDQEQSTFNMLNTLTTQLGAATDSLNRLHEQKTYTETILNSELASWRLSQSADNPQNLQKQLEADQGLLIILESRYTSDHPDVIKLKHDIAVLKKKVQESAASSQAPAPAKSAGSEPIQIKQLRAQLASIEAATKEKQVAQEQIQSRIQMFEGRLQMSPVVEEQFKSLTRDYQTAVGQYNDLLKKKNESEMATDLEKKQQSEQFRVMDSPNLPARPTFPDRRLFAAGGLGGGLALGLGFVALLEMREKALRTERDIEYFMELPTLAMVPIIDFDRPEGTNGKRRFWRRREPQKQEA